MSSSQSTQRKASTSEARYGTSATYNNVTTNPSKLSHQRVRTYWAQSLILFNIYGIPLSSGLWLEYTFTTLLPHTSLISTSLIFASYLLFLFAAITPSRWLYKHLPAYHRTLLLAAIITVSGSRIALIVRQTYPALLFSAALTSTGLGTLGALHTQRLASHYRNNSSLAATFGVASGFLGAVVHTALTWTFLRHEHHAAAHGATLAVFLVTSLTGIWLSQPSHTSTPMLQRAHRQPGQGHNIRSLAIALAVALLGATLLLAPLYTPLVFSQTLRPDAAAYVLLATFATALVTAPLAAKFLHGSRSASTPTVLIALASILSASGVIMSTFSPLLWVGVVSGAIYGAGLGIVASLTGRVFEGLSARWVSIIMGLAGIFAAGGVIGIAVALERRSNGMKIAMGAVAAGSVCLGVVVGIGGVMRMNARGA